jgi:hypothetical protein
MQHKVQQYSTGELEAVTANQPKCPGVLPILTSRRATCSLKQILMPLLM